MLSQTGSNKNQQTQQMPQLRSVFDVLWETVHTKHPNAIDLSYHISLHHPCMYATPNPKCLNDTAYIANYCHAYTRHRHLNNSNNYLLGIFTQNRTNNHAHSRTHTHINNSLNQHTSATTDAYPFRSLAKLSL